MMDQQLHELARRVGEALTARGLMLATAESCTGGGVGEAVTAIAGSSGWYERGFVTYTYISKREMLGVRPETLERHGAVSEQTVREMAAGALAASHAQVAVAVSGTAGPAGGTPDKPVGTVCFGWAVKNGEPRVETRHFSGDREAVRRQSVARALAGILELLEDGSHS
ncbi:MAG TPA: nicotinamide-nucleotide amidohydrolase family protein [Burkholderiales bacterium]|nr:nicotinamide-nucleotide amidohydrolase family protein [Burkholderiales bacterium]